MAVAPDENLLNPVEVNSFAMECGYIVHPKACTADVIQFLKTQNANLNTTFYKNWNTVEKLSEYEMHILQILHYISTYGTDYQGPTFTMNDMPEDMQFSNYTLLMPCTEKELYERIAEMLRSGIALADETLKPIIEQLSVYYQAYGWKLDVDEVMNREAMAMLCSSYGTVPSKPHNLFRYLYYSASETPLIIKNEASFKKIASSKDNGTSAILASLSDTQKRGLATMFYRYKPLFLAMRKNAQSINATEAVKCINEIRRLARKLHKPFRQGILELILNHSEEEIATAIQNETNTFKLVKLYNYIESKKQVNGLNLYVIRNGKSFLKKVDERTYDWRHLVTPGQLLRARIVELLSAKSKGKDNQPLTIKFPKYLKLAAPVSEKQFVGNIPYGSSYKLQCNNYIGIYWRNEWGTHDFDLWMIDSSGKRIGWANIHKTDEVMFSGDMTNADPEATEIFYGKENWPDCSIQVLRFNGQVGSKYRLFFGSDNIKKLSLNYMVNPDSIHFQEDIKSDKKQQVVGIVRDKNVYFASISVTNGRLPGQDLSLTFEKAIGDKFSCSLNLKEILLEAGFKEYDETAPDMPALPDIDLTNLTKDSIINIFK